MIAERRYTTIAEKQKFYKAILKYILKFKNDLKKYCNRRIETKDDYIYIIERVNLVKFHNYLIKQHKEMKNTNFGDIILKNSLVSNTDNYWNIITFNQLYRRDIYIIKETLQIKEIIKIIEFFNKNKQFTNLNKYNFERQIIKNFKLKMDSYSLNNLFQFLQKVNSSSLDISEEAKKYKIVKNVLLNKVLDNFFSSELHLKLRQSQQTQLPQTQLQQNNQEYTKEELDDLVCNIKDLIKEQEKQDQRQLLSNCINAKQNIEQATRINSGLNIPTGRNH